MSITDFDPRLPKGLTDCERIGLSGGCGKECPVYLNGECEVSEEIEDSE